MLIQSSTDPHRPIVESASHMSRHRQRMYAVSLITIAASLTMIGVAIVRATTPVSALQRSAAESIEAFQLPPKSAFDRAMPRYPNAWFYIDTTLAPSYRDAVKLVTDGLRDSMRLRECCSGSLFRCRR